jgi:hypothetical protein
LSTQKITSISEIALNVYGNELTKNGKISVISIKIHQAIYMFDFLEIMKEIENAANFIRLIGDYLSNESIMKTFHNCKFVKNLMLRNYNIEIKNIFDLDVS